MLVPAAISARLLAAQVATQACSDPVGGDACYTIQAINYNNLDPDNSGTAALLIHDPLQHSSAASVCSAHGESLFAFHNASRQSRQELDYELKYHTSSKSAASNSSFVWILGNNGTSQCQAYSIANSTLTSLPCDRQLPALCTSRLAPTTDQNRGQIKSPTVTVRSQGLAITGNRDKRSFRFLGIPFADPPVKKLRFMSPQNYTGPTSIDATQFRSSCIQATSTYKNATTESEDCLTLNVFTPIVPGQAPIQGLQRRPVAVYFYGGAFTEGFSARVDLDGGNFASRNGIVIVTVNYRLGILGFLATKSRIDGSMGIKDQIKALQWVREHIFEFGGDPDNVTIFGESAGAQSTLAVLSSSSAKGLFHKAIVQSAPTDLPWMTRDVYATIINPSLSQALGCGDTADEDTFVSCMQSLPDSSFVLDGSTLSPAVSRFTDAVALKYFHTLPFVAKIEPLMPIVDDTGSGVIDDQLDVLLASGKLPSRVPIMFSTVTEEARGFFPDNIAIPGLSGAPSSTPAQSKGGFPNIFSLIGTILSHGLSAGADLGRDALAAVLTASEWTCPQAFLLDLGAPSSEFAPAYEVQIGQGHLEYNVNAAAACLANQRFNETCHTADILPVWGTLNSKFTGAEPYFGPSDVHFSQLLNDIWSSFMQSSDPNPVVSLLGQRGPAYAYTAATLESYKMDAYVKGAEQVALLKTPPTKIKNPQKTELCHIISTLGFTFQKARQGS